MQDFAIAIRTAAVRKNLARVAELVREHRKADGALNACGYTDLINHVGLIVYSSQGSWFVSNQAMTLSVEV